jgi:hypothetical protein
MTLEPHHSKISTNRDVSAGECRDHVIPELEYRAADYRDFLDFALLSIDRRPGSTKKRRQTPPKVPIALLPMFYRLAKKSNGPGALEPAAHGPAGILPGSAACHSRKARPFALRPIASAPVRARRHRKINACTSLGRRSDRQCDMLPNGTRNRGFSMPPPVRHVGQVARRIFAGDKHPIGTQMRAA